MRLRYFLFSMILFLLSLSSFSFTLTTQSIHRWPKDEVTLDVGNVASCANTGLSHQDLLDLAFKAAEEYWNKVPTSRLTFIKGSVVGKNTDLSSGAAVGLQAGANTILIGCNTTLAFGSSAAVGGIVTNGSGEIAGGEVLLNAINTSWQSYSETLKLAILAHEIGHAFGLGHSEEDGLMYFASNTSREKLGSDDVAAISFLYPTEEEAGGLGGTCASISLINGGKGGGPPPWNFLICLGLGFLLMYFSSSFLKGVKRFRGAESSQFS